MPRHLRSLAALAAAALAAAVLPNGLSATAAPPTTGRGGPFHALRGFSPSGSHVRVHPDHYRAFSVDTSQVRAELSGTPRVGAGTSTTFAIPTPTGGTERFAVQRTSVMQPALAAAHPEITTWSGHAVGDPGTTIAMDVTPMGFHASVRPAGGQGTWYVDPAYNRRGTTQHLAYYGGALGRQAQQFAEREMPDVQRAAAGRASAPVASGGGGSVTQKVYRL
ncbi:MAG: M12 family metallo-peptidase, partial [Marmoricola sp.]